MPEFLILLLILAVTMMVFPGLISRFKFSHLIGRFKHPVSHTVESEQNAEPSEQPDMRILNSRVRPTKGKEGGSISDALVVEICGSIRAPGDGHYAIVRISITDVTDRVTEAKPVYSSIKQWQGTDSPVFCYNADIGRLPERVANLSDWTAVARLSCDWLVLPCKGERDLRFSTSILSRDSGEELAHAECSFSYENPEFGYLDLQENTQRTKTLAVALAFVVGAADNELFDCEVELIKNWARGNISVSQVSDKARRELESALNKTVAFFRGGNQVNIYEICREIAEIAPATERYDILELCLRVVQVKDTAAAEELAVLKELAEWLEVDTERFRDMMAKILPADMHKVEDAEVLLGVTSNMSKDEARQHLNREYRKWNSRVTNADPQIQSQADHMLRFIAQARSQYIG